MAQTPPFRRTVDMVEEGRVVVRHTFYGRDAAEAAHMEAAHREADASLDASMRGKPYKGTDIRAVRSKEAKDARGHGSERRALKVPTKDPAQMSGGEINKELDRHDASQSALNTELIDAGHGSVRFNDLPATGHPAALEMHQLAARTGQLRSEIARRYGPGAPSRLPKGFGPIRPLGEAKDERGHGSEKRGGAAPVPSKEEVRARFGAILKRLGATVDGVQDLTAIGMEPMLAYTDHVTGSSLLTPMSKATAGHLAQRLSDKRSSFGAPVKSQEVVACGSRLAEGGPGSGIVGHVDPALTAEARAAYAGVARRPRREAPRAVRATAFETRAELVR